MSALQHCKKFVKYFIGYFHTDFHLKNERKFIFFLFNVFFKTVEAFLLVGRFMKWAFVLKVFLGLWFFTENK